MTTSRAPRLEMFSLQGIPEVRAGDDIASLIVSAMAAAREYWVPGDVLAIAQKIVSKAEGRTRVLSEIVPTERAEEIAKRCGKDPRKVQAILDESSEVLRIVPGKPDGIVIARHRQGWVCANAGIDESNLGSLHGQLLLLPLDPDASARRIAAGIEQRIGMRPGILVTDTFGRPWRRGLVNVSIGISEVPPIVDWIGRADAYGRPLQVSQQALADELAAASGLLALKDAATPVVVVRNLRWAAEPDAGARQFVRPLKEDLFQ